MAVNYIGLALVLNCGSSSVKYQVVDTTLDAPLATGLIDVFPAWLWWSMPAVSACIAINIVNRVRSGIKAVNA